MKVLYIHGFNGSPNGSTGTAVKKFFGEENVVAPQLDLVNYEETMRVLEKLLSENAVEMIVSNSFGSFYALSLRRENLFTVIANPCVMPSLEIPKLDSSLSESWASEFKQRESVLYSEIPESIKTHVYGIFTDSDELFSYGEFFRKNFGVEINGVENQTGIHGPHKIPETELVKGLTSAVEFFK